MHEHDVSGRKFVPVENFRKNFKMYKRGLKELKYGEVFFENNFKKFPKKKSSNSIDLNDFIR